MTLNNREKQQRWRERHIARRRTAQRIAGLLVRQTWSDEHFGELGSLLQSLMNRTEIAALRRALRPKTNAEMTAINHANEVAVRDLWLREHPGRTAKEYERLIDSEVREWRRAKGKAGIESEQQAWEADHPGKKYPEHECSLTDREYTDLARWRHKYARSTSRRYPNSPTPK